MQKSISIVIPNYNGEQLLKENLPSLIIAIEAVEDAEIIVTDDCSSDNSCSFIEQNYEQILLIRNEENVGFAGNTNRGIFRATKELVLVLNTDVTLQADYFQHQWKYFTNASTFSVMGAIRSEDKLRLIDGAKFPDYGFGRINTTKNFTVNNKASYTFFSSGANAMFDRRKLQFLGGFLELFNPYYKEDAELGIRAWRMGWKSYFEPNSICFHASSATIKKEIAREVFVVNKRNKWLLHQLHLNGLELFWFELRLKLAVAYYSLANKRDYLHAYEQFRSKHQAVLKAKKSIVRQQEENDVALELKEIVQEIKKSLSRLKVKIF